MGQYYNPVFLKEDKKTPVAHGYSHNFGCGLKLMEHSWKGNVFVGYVEALMRPNNRFYKTPLVWAGDYANEEPDTGETLYSMCKNTPCVSGLKLEGDYDISSEFRYIVNHDKKLFVDKTKVPVDSDGWKIHPLPLLTAEGNGQGGGDFFGEDPNNLIGSWARDCISIETEAPEGFNEISFGLVE